ncbi:DUF58 domain-containing protein [Hansschlegelia plantiphila]|uniref:DUF58 domain-containing protein n=1 Tax=Hansschlegelia plantiphila TaxID=374655 RepID=A0A9W6J1N5_9HYPH|nr:DUF58 domain-containing protein [Hansschlegelia plantiphila]GLK69181.1 hypothetical protein GCM10008179_28190 [Hansschlegelia plantiphila]
MDGALVPGVDLDATALMGLKHLTGRGAPTGARRLAARPGGIVTRRRGRGSEIDDVRPWVDGDDIRHVDRNATARTGLLHARTFRDERERAVLLVADFRPAMLFGTRRAFRSVAAAEALAMVGWRAAAEGGRIGLLAVGTGEPSFVRPKGGERAMSAIVGVMARAHADALAGADRADPPLADSLETAVGALPRGGHLILASGLDEPGLRFDEVIKAAATRVAITVLLVADAFERDAPRGAYAFLSRDGRRGWLSGRQGGEAHADYRRERLAGLGVGAIEIDAAAGPERVAPLLERLDATR